MADKLVIDIELDPSLKGAGKGITKEAKKAGKKSGDAFEKSFKSETKNIGKSFGASFSKIGIVVAGIAGVAASLRSVTQAAIAQEDAVNRLNTSLKTAGDFSRGASLDLQAFASELQKSTIFGDELILNQIALAKSFGATNEQAKQVAQAAADLSAEFGIDLESATRNISKTLGGLSGELGEIIPELKTLGGEALKAGQGINFIASRFSGASQKQVLTFSGAVSQTSNAFGDLLEEFGFFITKNESIIKGFNLSADAAVAFSKGIKVIREEIFGIGEESSKLKKLNENLKISRDNLQGLRSEQKSLQDLVNNGSIAQSLGLQISEEKAKERLIEVTKRLGIEENTRLRVSRAIAKQRAEDKVKREEEQQSKLSELQLSQVYAQAQVQTEQQILEAQTNRYLAIQELRERGLISDQENNELKKQVEIDYTNAVLEQQLRREMAVAQSNESITASFAAQTRSLRGNANATGKILSNLAVNGFGKAAQAFGKAAAQGKNASQAFVDAAQEAAAGAASAVGDYYILEGAGRVAKSYGADPTGYKLLGIGAGMKVLAGALSGGVADRGGAEGGGGGGAGGGEGDNLRDAQAQDQQNVEREPTRELVVNVQGDFLQTDETGERLAEIISESAAKRGTLITDVRFS